MTLDYVKYDLIFNRKNKLNQQGKALVQVRAYCSGQSRFFSTNIYISPDEWNAKRMEIKTPIQNRKAAQFLNGLQTFETVQRAKVGRFSLPDFDLHTTPTPTIVAKPLQTFTDFYKTELARERLLAQASWRIRRRSLELITEFQPVIQLVEIDFKLLRNLEFFLESKKLHTNTIGKHLKHLRRYIILAIKMKVLPPEQNPFGEYKIKSVPSKKQFLESEELARFEVLTFEPTEKRMEKIRDAFLFSCYTSLRISDVLKIKSTDFQEVNLGLKLDYQANKTEKFGIKHLDILFDGKPQTIARKYMPEKADITLFKGVTNPKANKALKILAKRANIDKALCYKDSRNTFGCEVVQRASIILLKDEMQHSSVKTTMQYLTLSQKGKEEQLKAIKWQR
jgi:integrase